MSETQAFQEVKPLELIDNSIGSFVQLVLKEKREIFGKLVSFDDYLNMILQDVTEVEVDDANKKTTTKKDQILLNGSNIIMVNNNINNTPNNEQNKLDLRKNLENRLMGFPPKPNNQPVKISDMFNFSNENSPNVVRQKNSFSNENSENYAEKPIVAVTPNSLHRKRSTINANNNNNVLTNSSTTNMATQNNASLNIIQSENSLLKSQNREYKTALIQFIKENIKYRNQERAARLIKNNAKIGYLKQVRHGMNYIESWEKGAGFIKCEKDMAELNLLRGELEKQKKQLSKDFKTNRSVDQFNQLDMVKYQLAMLKRQENDINAKIAKLIKCRNEHVKELKNAGLEVSSNFKQGSCYNDDKYMLLRLIGKGGFSEVFEAYDLDACRNVAIKIHQVSSEWKEPRKLNYFKHTVREYEIHKQLDHANVVKLYDMYTLNENVFFTVMEYCETDLDMVLRQQKYLSERDAKLVISQVVAALRYLNELDQPVIHYDLKPANILFKNYTQFNWTIKLTDFGLSKLIPREIIEDDENSGLELTSQGAGTYWYLPPECFVMGKQPPKITSKVDVWSVGVVFYQCVYGVKPFGDKMNQPLLVEKNVILNARTVEFKAKPLLTGECKNFIKRCLTYSKDERPDVLQLAADPYLTSQSAIRTNVSFGAANISGRKDGNSDSNNSNSLNCN